MKTSRVVRKVRIVDAEILESARNCALRIKLKKKFFVFQFAWQMRYHRTLSMQKGYSYRSLYLIVATDRWKLVTSARDIVSIRLYVNEKVNSDLYRAPFDHN